MTAEFYDQMENCVVQDMVIGNMVVGQRPSYMGKDKIFQGIHAEDFELEVKDQQLSIPNLNHELKFNRLWISTADSILQLDTLEIHPSNTSDSLRKTNLELRQVALDGIDYRRLYESLELSANNLVIDKPDLVFKEGKLGSPQGSSQNLIKSFPLKLIKINELSLDSGSTNLSIGKSYKPYIC